MRKSLIIPLTFTLIVLAASCSKSFLDTNPSGDYTDASVWKDPALVASFVNDIYNNTLGWPFALERLSDYSDESFFPPDFGSEAFNRCLMTSEDLTGWSQNFGLPDPTPDTYHYQWAFLYKNMRACNLFFSKIKGVPFSDDAVKSRTIGEVYFLRAYNYHYLVAMYGGVPLITKPYRLNEDYSIARNTYEECINYIVSQLDSAAALLPVTYTGSMLGHATKGATLSLKARTLLYAASDLHNSASISAYAPGYEHPELLGYKSGSQADRWQAARYAAKAVMDMGIYSLYKPDPAQGDSVASNIADYFVSYGDNEDILLQYFTSGSGLSWSDYNPALYCGPLGYHNWGNNTPIGDLVDDYEMNDGTSFDWSNPFEAAKPYSNREARFYATILYEGCPWRKRPADVQSKDPWDKIQVGHVYGPDGMNELVPGIDTHRGAGSIDTYSGDETGYYLRKAIDTKTDPLNAKQDIPFRHIRYAEVLLNYAEACIEMGGSNLQPGISAMNMVRHRAGLPDRITGDQATARTWVRHERRIELAFENHRFWDVRRWVIGPAAYHQTHKIFVKYIAPADARKYRQADGSTWGDPVYLKEDLGGDARAWLDKAYFFPIMQDEINANSLLIQNPGY
jgi:hypothetical protein